MTRGTWCWGLSVGLLLLWNTARSGGPVVDTKDELQGSWSWMESKFNGKTTTFGAPARTLKIEGSRFEITVDDRVTAAGHFHVCDEEEPTAFDRTDDFGAAKGMSTHFILRLEGDSLTLAHSGDPVRRATNFEAKEGTKAIVSVYRRRD